MRNKQFYPSYIPGKWIHYAHHKKKRIRKKYQNRILREARRQKKDAETLAFLLADAAARYSQKIGYSQAKTQRLALLGGCWCDSTTSAYFRGLTLPQLALPEIALPEITVQPLTPGIGEGLLRICKDHISEATGLPSGVITPETPDATQDALEELNKAFEQLRESIVEAFKPIIDAFAKLARKLWKWTRDIADRFWCNNRRWWYMAEHHKKYRIRKKYRNKIKRAARERAREALPELLEAIRSDDSEATSDDEEGP